jgi:hypothetical protein
VERVLSGMVKGNPDHNPNTRFVFSLDVYPYAKMGNISYFFSSGLGRN